LHRGSVICGVFGLWFFVSDSLGGRSIIDCISPKDREEVSQKSKIQKWGERDKKCKM
jgi:hypothetical protein